MSDSDKHARDNPPSEVASQVDCEKAILRVCECHEIFTDIHISPINSDDYQANIKHINRLQLNDRNFTLCRI